MRLSPVARITFGLVLLTISILLTGNLIGLTPDTRHAALEARQRFCESLAVQLTLALGEDNPDLAQATVETLVEHDPQILSAALRRQTGETVVETSQHQRHWQAMQGDQSTPSQVQVPVFKGQEHWGTVEVRFTPLGAQDIAGWLAHPFVQLLLFVTVAGSLVYYVMMKKTLKHLDPSAVIPARVRSAMDVLAEGVVLMDEQQRIVLANTAFAGKLGVSADSLLGSRLARLNWRNPDTGKSLQALPWDLSHRDGKTRTGIAMRLELPDGSQRTLMANSAPILDGKGTARGSLTTFDDVTTLEEKNTQLEKMLQMLEKSQHTVNEQNEQLRLLATQDPLTGCLNRRALFDHIQELLDSAVLKNTPLCCLMCDIDNFKRINDQYGHLAGDKVIRGVADALKEITRDGDLVARFGGEEFCILLPGMGIEHGAGIAERLRTRVESMEVDGIRVTTSFGLMSTDLDVSDAHELLQKADEALYRAKNQGRNRVIIWTRQPGPGTGADVGAA